MLNRRRRKALPRLFNMFDEEYTEGVPKKHRPEERCQVLDKYDTIKMRNEWRSNACCDCFSTICGTASLLPSS
jgi:hypothetical protein